MLGSGRASASAPLAPPEPVTPEIVPPPAAAVVPPPGPLKAETRELSFWYGSHQVLDRVSLGFQERAVTAIIGPSGCGKSTLLRCFNRMHDLYPGNRYGGQIILYPSGINIVGPSVSAVEMRMRFGMVFQKPNPFPKSVFENVAYGLRIRGVRDRTELERRVEEALRAAALWDEVKDHLRKSAYDLSGGQQQRLCIARALATDPEIILFDEPTSALDPIATGRIEELIKELRRRVTIIIVTHNMAQAARVSDYTAFLFLGRLVECGPTEEIFLRPRLPQTEQYVTGRFG